MLRAPERPTPPRICLVKEGGGSCCVWLVIAVVCFLALLMTGCATTRTQVIVSGEVDGVDVAAVVELQQKVMR